MSAPVESTRDDAASRRDPRYAPGADAEPLLRGLGGGLAGVGALLVLDYALAGPLAVPPVAGGVPAAVRATWPVMTAAALGLGPAPGVGVAALAAAGALGGLVYAYGRFRRFVPAPAWVRGAAWGMGLAVIAGPFLAPGAARWLGAGTGLDVMAAAALLVAEIVLGLIAYGAVLGWLNPPRP